MLSGLCIAAFAPVSAQVSSARPSPTVTAQPDPSGALPDRIARARVNLEALRAGRLSTSQLTAQELQDVIDLDRLARGAATDHRTFRQQCIDEEVRRNGGNPSRLAWQVIRLKCQ
jgi:hypothetical protein